MARTVRKVSMYTLMALLLSVIVLMVVLSVISYDRATNAQAQAQVLRNLSSRVHSRGAQVSLFLQKQLSALEGATLSFADEAPKGESGVSSLRAARQTLGLRWLCFIDAEGQALRDDGKRFDLSESPCAQRSLAGESLLCDGEIDGQPCILVAAPAGEGALLGCLDETALRGELLSNGGNVCLLRADGRVIATAPGSMLEDMRGKNLFAALEMDESAADAIRAGGNDARGVETALGSFYATWTTLEDANGWQLVTLVPQNAIMGQFSFMNEAATVLEVRLGLCALGLIALVIWMAWESNRRLRAEKLRLEWSEERYRILAEDTNEVFWEYDVLNDHLRLGENFRRVYGREGSRTIAEFLAVAHPDEREAVERIFNILKGGMSAETHATIDFRVRLGGESERYAWCRAHMSVLFDGRRRRRWIIGKLTDISQERMLTERLEQQARTDALTGLLNRAGLEEAVRLRLEGAPQQSCAIVLLDIDDFKDINDFYGHDVGDEVLRTLANFLRGHFRGTDIVGRLGGDEFMALMEGVRDHERLQQALCRLKQGLATLHAGEVRVGCSAGAVLFPEGGDTFDALYKSADVALYDAKRAGKGRFTVYDGDDGRFFAPQMLEHADYIAYAIDPETRELLFANAKMCARFPTLRPGEKCYHALMAGANAPCEGCDARKLLDQAREGAAVEAEALCAEWLRAAPTPVRWPDGRDALLFTCKPPKSAREDGERP